jgi:MFS transporter, DHA2 family, multidrug resistance protein
MRGTVVELDISSAEARAPSAPTNRDMKRAIRRVGSKQFALYSLIRNLGGAIGIAACGTILNDRAPSAFPAIGRASQGKQHSNGGFPAAGQLWDMVKWGGASVHGHAAALKQLWSLTWREAQTQTYADAFLAMAACFVVATAMVPPMRKVIPPKGPTADAH